MDNNAPPLKTRAKAKGKYSNGAPPQTLPQPAAWQKREPPMQVILRRLKEYERRLKRINDMCTQAGKDRNNHTVLGLASLIIVIAEGKDR
jgi:hypothetical protein